MAMSPSRVPFVALLAALTLTPAVWQLSALQTLDRVDEAAVAKIRDEGLRRSQVMDTVFWLTDRYGPRLTGSPEFDEAADWTIKRLTSWGVSNVRKERFAFGRGWSLVKFHATMTSPRVMPIIAMPRAWTPGLAGLVTADVVRPQIVTAADAAKYAGTLRGKIVLTQPAREVRMLDQGDGTVLRYDDQDGKWRKEAMTPEPEPAGERAGGARGTGARGARGGGRGTAKPPSFSVLQFYKDEGVVALFDRGDDGDLAAGGSNLSWVTQRVDGGTIVLERGSPSETNAAAQLPQVTLAVEHYNRMVRLLDHQVPVRVELQLETRDTPQTEPRGYNIVGEIPGTDKADEVVLLGAHFDSWHAGTGATDNAVGVAAMMEVLRIFHAAGLRPRRTVRVGLWGGEENDLLGSEAYVREHLGTSASPKPELAKLAAYFNLDNGTGSIRGVWMQQNTNVRPIFEVWRSAVADLGVNLLSPRAVQQTDHVSFDRVGVPAFQFVQERYEYNSRTHHTNMDVYDRVQADDVKQVAVVAAVFAWHAATRDNRLPSASGSR